MRTKDRGRQEWTPRVGEASVEKLILGMRDLVIQVSAGALIFLMGTIPVLFCTQTRASLPALFRFLYGAIGVATVLFGNGADGLATGEK